MTVTEILRRLLDECGVEYEAMLKLHDRMNVALLEYERALGIEKADGTIVVPLVVEMHSLLEEAATLGSCNCSDNCTNSERTVTCYDTCESRIFHCSECGLGLDDVYIDDEEHYPFADFPRFCPWCGAKVVDSTTNYVDAEVGDD